MAKKPVERCDWGTRGGELMAAYHDEEWGVPVHDDRKQFEFLTLESAQAGLSWLVVLRKREAYRKAFADFDPEKVARFTAKQDRAPARRPRHHSQPAQDHRRDHQRPPTFSTCRKNSARSTSTSGASSTAGRSRTASQRMKDLPATSKESDALSKDLKQRGFKFVGSTIIYAHMQAVGMVNDHLVTCFRHKAVGRKK